MGHNIGSNILIVGRKHDQVHNWVSGGSLSDFWYMHLR